MFVPRILTRRGKPPASLNPPAEADLEKLRALREGGSKMDLPHPLRCFLDFPGEAEARSAMERLEKEAMQSQLRAEPDGRWTVTVVERIVPSPGAVTRLRETLTEAAESVGGRFRDWTAPLVY